MDQKEDVVIKVETQTEETKADEVQERVNDTLETAQEIADKIVEAKDEARTDDSIVQAQLVIIDEKIDALIGWIVNIKEHLLGIPEVIAEEIAAEITEEIAEEITEEISEEITSEVTEGFEEVSRETLPEDEPEPETRKKKSRKWI